MQTQKIRILLTTNYSNVYTYIYMSTMLILLYILSSYKLTYNVALAQDILLDSALPLHLTGVEYSSLRLESSYLYT